MHLINFVERLPEPGRVEFAAIPPYPDPLPKERENLRQSAREGAASRSQEC